MHDRLSLYRHRIQEAFPNLTVHTLRLIDHGQSNDVVVMDEEIVFRFPRYPGVVAEVGREADILRRLRGRLPLPIPDPIYICLEDPEPGSAFVGYAAVPGEPLHAHALEGAARVEQAGQGIAKFLLALHQIPPEEVLETIAANRDPVEWWEAFAQRIYKQLLPMMRTDARDQVRRTLEDGVETMRTVSTPRVLLHGDLGASNILCDTDTGLVTGVIDFGSVHVGDPALDLASASTIGEKFYGALVRHYPNADQMLDRVSFYQSTFALQEALFGVEHGEEEAFRAGIAEFV